MPYWDEENTNNRLGYNVDSEGHVSKYSRLTNFFNNNHDKNVNHGHEVYDPITGTYGYRGENASKEEFRKDFDNAKYRHD